MRRQPPKQFLNTQIQLLINKHDLWIVFVDDAEFLLSKDYLLNAKITNGSQVIHFIDLGVEFLLPKEQADKISGKRVLPYQITKVLSVMQGHKIF